MDFKTHSDENGTKTFPKLEEAFEYAEDNDDVEKISFVLPTDEKVVLTKGLLGWEYDPIENAGLSSKDVETLEFAMPGKNDEACYPSSLRMNAIDLLKRGLIEIVDGQSFTSKRGMKALVANHLTSKR